MSHFERERERETLRTMLDQIERGEVVLKQGADEILSELQQRLAGLDQRDTPLPSD